jgi:TonB family protein
VGALVAGELLPGEAVGVEILLPSATDPLRTRALVRHYDRLRYGMEFVGLSLEQQAAIRGWAGEAKAEVEVSIRPKVAKEIGKGLVKSGLDGGGVRPPSRRRNRRGWILLLLSAAILLAVLWWRWNRSWEDLESGLQRNRDTVARPQTHVPADVMQKHVIHRVDPDYPAAARPEKLHGVIVLDVIVGRDGSVADMHAQNGPEILARAAMEALRWWRFEPYRVDGQPVVVETTVAVEFKP